MPTLVTSAIRFMKRNAASTMPTCTATVRSTSTVRRNVVSRTATSLLGVRRSCANARHSLMWYATTTRIAASVASGMYRAHFPRKRNAIATTSACIMPATGVRPPFLTLVAVRAMAPVAGIPPKSPDAMFATPCATSSMLELWRLPIMPSATTAESSDSMRREQRDGDGGGEELAHAVETHVGQVRRRDRGMDLAEAGADRLDGKTEPRREARRREDRDDRRGDGARDPRPGEQDRQGSRGHADRGGRDRRQARAVGAPLRQERRRDRAPSGGRAGPGSARRR